MKLAVLSDIHLDMNSNFVGKDLLSVLIDSLRKQEVDLLLIAGDLSDNAGSTIRMLDEIEERLKVKVLFIPGNHDIWVKSGGSSWDSYRQFADHPSTFINKPYAINEEYVIIGDMGWFDYSLAVDGIPERTILAEREDWGDYKYTNWEMEDSEINRIMLKRLEKQLKEHKDKQIIFVTHFVPYKEYVIPSNEYMDWDIYNAFMGSASIGNLIEQYENIKYVIFGHTHERYPHTKKAQKTIICNPLGYIAENKVETFRQELAKSLTILCI